MSYAVLQCPVLTAKERPHPPLFAADESAFRAVPPFLCSAHLCLYSQTWGHVTPKVKCYDLRSTRALRVEGDRYPEQYDARFEISIHALRVEGDSMREVVTLKEYYISIHALRVEGDVIYIFIFVFVPSISIHALRVEGDPHNMYAIACTHFISIHALRVEGDSKNGQNFRLFLRKREKNLPL